MEILALIVAIGLFGLLAFMKRRKISFGIRVITGAILGLALGFLFQKNTQYVAIFGRIYANLLFAMVIPLLLASVIKIMISTENLSKLKSMGLKTVGILSLHNVLGSLIGVILAVVFKIGKDANFPINTSTDVKEVPSVADAIINFFPKNVVADAANGSVIPIIVFAVLIGIAILQLVERGKEEKVQPFVDFIESLSEIIFRLIGFITDFTPYAVLSLLANAVGRIDYSAVKPLVFILVLTYVASFIHSYITTGVLVSVFARLNPIKFFKKNWPVQVIGFTTQSSVGTIPANVENLEKEMGVKESIASFVAAAGATMGMPGCAGFWPVMSAILTVNVLGMDFHLSNYIMLIFVALAVSLGTVGVPGTATITTTAVFAAMGLPIEMVVILAPISSLADMGRTATNVTAAASSALIVAASEDAIDEDIYNS